MQLVAHLDFLKVNPATEGLAVVAVQDVQDLLGLERCVLHQPLHGDQVDFHLKRPADGSIEMASHLDGHLETNGLHCQFTWRRRECGEERQSSEDGSDVKRLPVNPEGGVPVDSIGGDKALSLDVGQLHELLQKEVLASMCSQGNLAIDSILDETDNG